MAAGDFLAGPVHETLDEILDAYAYRMVGTKARFEEKPTDGAPAIYWTGNALESRPFNLAEHRLRAFQIFSDKIKSLGECAVIDLGAGTCIQAVVLRASGSSQPVICVDVFKSALEIGETLCRKLKIEGISFAVTDLSKPKNFEPFAKAVQSAAAGRPLVVISRHAIYPFYSEGEYTNLFDFLVRDLKVSAGLHLERTGRFTPTFQKLQAPVPFQLTFPRKHTSTDDPLQHLTMRSDIKISEDQEIWPHFVNEYFPRFISWVRR
ncbi:MAG: hypothetical protein AB7E79_11905 [Rhodospirillaceae bacterium]